MTIARIRSLLDKGEFSCAELTEKYLAAFSGDPINAVVLPTPETAMEAARAFDGARASGKALPPLAGIPMTLKDNLSTKGLRTTCCSEMLREYVPVYDAAVWEALRAQGAVLLGKTNMDEFAMGSTCETSCFGPTKNPRNHNRVPGGSSGGTAAAVGGNLAVYGLGSDTGGSIRQPGAFCGVVGMKPTYGSVSRWGLFSMAPSLDQAGPLTTCVEDAALVFDAISKKDSRDATSVGAAQPAVPHLKDSLRGVKIGVVGDMMDLADQSIRPVLERAAGLFRDLGAELIPLQMPEVLYGLPIYCILCCAEVSSSLGRYDGVRYGYHALGCESPVELFRKSRSQSFGAEVKRRVLTGTYVLSAGYADAYYKEAQQLRGGLAHAFEKAFEVCDLMVSPTAPTTAFPLNGPKRDAADTYRADICTVPANLAGLPAVSVPCGFGPDGLPVGLQIMGRHFEDHRVLNAAYQYEQARGVFPMVEGGVCL